MDKKGVATASPQEYPKESLDLDGLVLVTFVSVEDQDTFDTDMIAKQGADEIMDVVDLIETFPKKIEDYNEEARKFNEEIERKKEAGEKGRERLRALKKLILSPDMYRVDKVLVYPWAHLSNSLSNEDTAKDVCPKIAAILKERGKDAYYSPFGWYKAFKIECLGDEVGESFRDVKLAINPENVRARSRFAMVTEKGEWVDLCTDEDKKDIASKIPKRYKTPAWRDFHDAVISEVVSVREQGGEEPPHIKLMQQFEIADFEPLSDPGNLRWYTKGVIMKNLLKDYIENMVLDQGYILVDTPVMYTVKNKRLTAQTARFPAKTYWVHSGDDRFLLRFASDFLLFSLFAEMNIKEESLPLGAYEWEQYAFRREQKGELSGLRRLRAFTMPDLHTMCKDLPQAAAEFKRQFLLDNQVLSDIGAEAFMVIRTTEDFWESQKDWIIDIIKQEGKPALFEIWPERYYYFILKFERVAMSASRSTSTLSTIQIDVESSAESIEVHGKQMMKYNITYKNKAGEIGRPVILHNSPSGGIERVIWALLEGNVRLEKERVPGFKTWLSPVQVRVMSIGKDQNEYAEGIMKQLNDKGFRADFDDRDETVNKKIRNAEMEWIPYLVVVGGKEVEAKTVSVRKRLIGQKINANVKNPTSKQVNNIPLDDLVAMLEEDCKGFPRRKLPLPFRYYSTRISFRQ